MVFPKTFPAVKLETARTFVPGWWVHAFEAAASLSSQGPSVVGVCDAGLLPRFTPQELSLLAVLLGDVQRQMLESDVVDVIELDWIQSQKHLSGVDLAAKERLARVFESLSQLRFPVSIETSEISCVPLFENETWVSDPTNPHNRKLRLRPSSLAVELLTGYTDTHLDLIRRLTGGHSLSAVNRKRLPLVLWTPVWLELSVPEQVVYARMEAAMQDEAAWIRLDGLVGCSLEEVTSGLKLAKKTTEPTSLLMERLRLVGKLGRRLMAHGVIQREPSTGYMALDKRLTGLSPLLMWQASSERLKSRAEAEYFGLASSKVLKEGLTPQIGRLNRIFAALSGAEQFNMTSFLDGVWRSIVDQPGCGFIFGPGNMAQAHILFMEWIARSQEGSLLPLPEQIRKNAVFGSISGVSATNALQKFREFLSLASRSDDLRLAVNCDARFSMSFGALSEDIEKICKKAAIDRSSLSDAPASQVGEKALKTPLIQPTAVPSNASGVKSESRLPTKQDSLAQNLRRLAQDELDKMVRQSPGAYADLKEKYIASLDQDTKSLVLDVQRRLGSKTFDRHLRIRLVHYMVEHPASWNSISTRLPI